MLTPSMVFMSSTIEPSSSAWILAITRSFDGPMAPTATQKREIWSRPAAPSVPRGLRAMALKFGSGNELISSVGALGWCRGYARSRR